MCPTCTHRKRGSPSSQIDRYYCVTHLTGSVAHRIFIARTQTTVGTEPPAHDRLVVANGARVIGTCAHGTSATIRAQIDPHECITHLARLIPTHDGVTCAELTVGVLTPTHDRVVVEQRARVRHAGGDRASPCAARQLHRSQRSTHLACLITPIRRIADTELSARVRTEAHHRTVVSQHARVIRTRRHLRDRRRSTERNVDGDKVVTHLVRRPTDARHRTGADLSRRVRTEAHHRVVVAHHARVRIAQVDVSRNRRAECGCSVTAAHRGATGIGRRVAGNRRARGDECGSDDEPRRHAPAAWAMQIDVCGVLSCRVHGERT
jgi:hypothetical protein